MQDLPFKGRASYAQHPITTVDPVPLGPTRPPDPPQKAPRVLTDDDGCERLGAADTEQVLLPVIHDWCCWKQVAGLRGRAGWMNGQCWAPGISPTSHLLIPSSLEVPRILRDSPGSGPGSAGLRHFMGPGGMPDAPWVGILGFRL